jgi:hypothetical protein
MDRSLCIDLIHRTRSILNAIQTTTQNSRGKFTDRELGEVFCRTITGDIEKLDLLLNGFLNYIKSTSPVIRRDTVNILIDEAVKKNQIRLEERKIRVFKKFERELPETIVPDIQMMFILDSLIQYAAVSMPSGSGIEIVTRSSDHLPEPGEGHQFPGRRSKHVEVVVTFTDYQKLREQRAGAYGVSRPQKNEELDLLLRLVRATVERNQGTIEFEADETKAARSVVLKMLTERRKEVHYPLVDEDSSPFDRNPYVKG